MPSELTLVKPVALPTQSAVATVYESMNLADALRFNFPLAPLVIQMFCGDSLFAAAILDRMAHWKRWSS